jgi:hypothetical protein
MPQRFARLRGKTNGSATRQNSCEWELEGAGRKRLLYVVEQAKEDDVRGYERESSITDSQLAELQNMRVLLEEARALTRNLAYYRRARLEASIERTLEEVERHIESLRSERG